MTCKQASGWRFTLAVAALVTAFSALGFAAIGSADRALAQDEPDFLVLNPQGE
jgi:hypothetical protein